MKTHILEFSKIGCGRKEIETFWQKNLPTLEVGRLANYLGECRR